jgi:hypothetical protein
VRLRGIDDSVIWGLNKTKVGTLYREIRLLVFVGFSARRILFPKGVVKQLVRGFIPVPASFD